jgi:AcrR family transcriptional regulator
MARTQGSKNAEYEARKRALARAVLGGLTDDEGTPATLRGLARACEVSVPTLKHYFTDYDGAVRAALALAEEEGQVHLNVMADPGRKRLPASLREAAAHLVQGWSQGVGGLFSSALTQGLGHPARGPAVVDHLLEPTLRAFERRLQVHKARGELAAGVDLRFAGLAFLSPLLMALLHQHGLGGVACRPLDVGELSRRHIEAWLVAYGR